MTSSKRLNAALVEYIQRESWDEVSYILNTYYCSKKNTKKRFQLFTGRRPKLHEGVLLLACSKRAPRTVIETMCAISPEQIQVRDPESGWYSITFAIKARAPEDSIQFLAENFPLALTSPDIYKMQTPLHVACQQQEPGSSMNLIKILCENGKSALGMECGEGLTPMEVAILTHDMDARVLDFLHKATAEYWTQRRRSDERFRITSRKSKPKYGHATKINHVNGSSSSSGSNTSTGTAATAATTTRSARRKKNLSRMNSPAIFEESKNDGPPEFINVFIEV
mmetsp:Transcript_213/g.368  ORF Transcript_213/g.368 Transcript_213/m.368 type:complete len:281 (+) Transcript_213:45-887(+)